MQKKVRARYNEISTKRFSVMEDEFHQLSKLNSAMFNRVFRNQLDPTSFFWAEYDKTSPKDDECTAPRLWNVRMAGDFYIVRRVHDAIYAVVGDATGHHAYAGGLQVFVAVAMERIFDQMERASQRAAPAEVVRYLLDFFHNVGAAAIPEDPLEGGASLVVIRVDLDASRTVHYASAGLPVYALGAKGLPRTFGAFHEFKSVMFAEEENPMVPLHGTIDSGDLLFLVCVTDGFKDLGRAKASSGRRGFQRVEEFGEERGVAGAAARQA